MGVSKSSQVYFTSHLHKESNNIVSFLVAIMCKQILDHAIHCSIFEEYLSQGKKLHKYVSQISKHNINIVDK